MASDHAILTRLEERWQGIIETGTDPKLQTFFSILDAELLLKSRNPERKLVIFSESRETTDYLKERLAAKGHQDVLAISSKNRRDMQTVIKNNFDANVPVGKQSSEYNIIVTTEVLAEGVNLHRSNTVLNYDTPWNTTRLMQRIGRVNRIGTKSDKIYIYNFFPTEKVEDDIQLRRRAVIKLQAFHSALGEDSQIYSTDEQVESFGLFDKDPQEDTEVNERLKYLMEIRKFKEEAPDEFKRLQNLPPKLRNAVENRERRHGTLTYLRSEQHHAFYSVDQDGDPKELGFLEAAPIFKCDPSTQALPLHEGHHEQVGRALAYFVQQAEEKIVKEQQNPTLTPPQNRAIHYVKAMQNWEHTGKEEQQVLSTAIETIRKGKFQALPPAINKLQNSAKKGRLQTAVQLESLLTLIRLYPLEAEPEPATASNELAENRPRIIISQSYV
ncbi:ATP-dependent RNA helicase RhlB [Candidatus Entotheonellaceae bacterium PAL068K]